MAADDGIGPEGRRLQEILAERTGTDPADWFLTYKARYGMEVVFASIRELEGAGDVLTQLYTCCTAVDPILAAGLRPVYADISRDSLGIDPNKAEASDATRAVVIQHTFGIIDEHEGARLVDLAHDAGALAVEDSAHCVCRMLRDQDGHPLADVSIHSFGVEKILGGTYFGGAVWVNPQMEDGALRSRIAEGLRHLQPLDARHSCSARHYRNQIRLLNHLPVGLSERMRERWAERGDFEPAVADAERRARLPLEPMAPDAWICSQAASALAGLEENERCRSACVAEYRSIFADAAAGNPHLALEVPDAAVRSDQPLLRFPIFLKDSSTADRGLAGIKDMGLYTVRWYHVLMLPGVLDEAAYGIEGYEQVPETVRLAEGALCLPTDIRKEQAREVAEYVVGLAREKDGARLDASQG